MNNWLNQYKIFVLEDNEIRIDFFKKICAACTLVIATNAEEAIKLLKQNEYDIILLDHDLGGEIYVNSNEQNTGFQVVKYMILNKLQQNSYIIIHSMNYIGAKLMLQNLLTNGYEAEIIPFSFILEMHKKNNPNFNDEYPTN